MEHPKFIITSGGHLRMGMVTLHRDLLMPHEDCLGGGFYEFDYTGNSIVLSGKSFDYGTPRWSKVQTLKVPEAYRGMTIVYRGPWGEDINLTSDFRIEYY